MGYISKKIAKEITSPAKVSLSGVSNFLELEAEKDSTEYKKFKITFEVLDRKFPDKNFSDTWFEITESHNSTQKYKYIATRKESEVNNQTFLITSNDRSIIAENIRACLLKNIFFRNNFSITIPYQWDGEKAVNGHILVIESLGAGPQYNFSIEIPPKSLLKPAPIVDPDEDYDNTSAELKPYWEIDGGSDLSQNNDMIDHGMGDHDIEVDVYTDTEVFLGMPDHPTATNSVNPGRFLTTLVKSYSGQPIWFDVNALMSTSRIYSNVFLKSGTSTDNQKITWVDTGTMQNVRLIARTNNNVERSTFYYSNVLYIINGYTRTLGEVDMDEYIFAYDYFYTHLIQPLTNQPQLTHVVGQSQYFNFIFSDAAHNTNLESEEYSLGIFYEFYTQSGQLIDTKRSLMQSRTAFAQVNTVKLDIDEMIAQIETATSKTVGLVRVGLCDDTNVASKMLDYKILPSCLHKVNDFAFLNALGGWSSFNFAGEKSVTSKADSTSYYKNMQPANTISSSIESVLDKSIKETYSVKTAPITAQVADWLKELSASIAVYELSTLRYVVIDDFDVKHTTKDDLFVLEMKYHYSDTYNAVIK